MDYNFHQNINKKLSPFGRQVLNMLTQNKKADYDRRNDLQPRQQRYKNKNARNRIITFGESHSDNNKSHNNTIFGDHSYEDISLSVKRLFEFPTFEEEPLPAPAALPVVAPANSALAPANSALAPANSALAPANSALAPTNSTLAPANSALAPANSTLASANSAVKVPTTAELVAATENNNGFQTRSVLPSLNFDTIHIVEDKNTILDEIYGSSDDEYDIMKEESPKNNAINVIAKPRRELSRNIQWDDMFDTEMLSQIDETCNTLEKSKLNKQTNFQIQFPNHTETTNNHNLKKPKQTNQIKKSKRKNATEITDKIPKKVKRVKSQVCKSEIINKEINKKCFRKEKYTKTVSNWLNNVDPNNPVDDDTANSYSAENQALQVTEDKQLETKTHNNKPLDAETHKDKQLETATHKDNQKRKVVQAKLANKGGIMKFKNPHSGDQTTEPEIKCIENKTPEKKNTKENKNSRPKFVAPIKSQIPVEDITYDIQVVTEENAIGEDLRTAINKDIAVVLVYTNGFCQLNKQHTTSACLPEGLLLLIGEKFYYFKGADIKEALSKLIKDNTTICYDGKYIFIHLMMNLNLEFDTELTIMDTKIAGSLLSPDSPPETFAELQRLAASPARFTVATECSLQRAAWYLTMLADCAAQLRVQLQREDLWTVYTDIEMPIVTIIAEMECHGMSVDTECLQAQERVLAARMQLVQRACHRAAGRPFQLTSAAQVRALLYDELQLDTKLNVKIRETVAQGAKSTSEAMLRALSGAHRLPRLILDYRHLHKAHAASLAGVAAHVRAGVVRPTWEQMAAATGRISCSNPNLQAIPKAPFSLSLWPDDEVEEDQANSVQEEAVLQLRAAYVCGPGSVLLGADFRHAECRVLSAAAGDARLAAALQQPDLFKHLAAEWLHVPMSAVSEVERERTKRIVYAGLYGAGTRKLMDLLDVDYQQALNVSASFNRTFPSLKQFAADVVAGCERAGGAARSLLGRRRALPALRAAPTLHSAAPTLHSAAPTLHSAAPTLHSAAGRARAMRQAVNFVVQGTAADLCKLAMAGCARALAGAGVRARLLLQIHDELLWELPAERLHEAAGVVRAAMEQCGVRAGLPALPVRLAAGRSWAALQPLESQDGAAP